jgi:hypothetical protein
MCIPFQRLRTLALMLALGLGAGHLPGIVQAQTTPLSPPSGLGNIPEAPVGHRQPRQSDLPPNVQREEQNNELPLPTPRDQTTRREKNDGSTFGQIPTICVKC